VVREKRQVALSETELERQLRVAEWFVERHDIANALGVLREWLVSFILQRRADSVRWLDYGSARKPVEIMLNALDHRAQHDLATETEQRLAAIWSKVAGRRNRFAHAGMTEDLVRVSDSGLGGLIAECRALLEADVSAAVARHRGPRLLVTPLGRSAGVLYSAVRLLRPDAALIITSAEARGGVAKALSAAGAEGLPCTVREMTDPFAGFREARDSVAEARPLLVHAGEIVVNLTGGLTVMQYVVDQIAEEARRLGVPVRRIALVDRRSPEAQRTDPFVQGELIALDGKEDEDAGSAEADG
jgi:hypothetical protein